MTNRPFDVQDRGLHEVSGIFNSREELERLMDELERHGVREDVSVLMTDQTREHYGEHFSNRMTGQDNPEIEHSSKMPEGATTGGLTGGLLGALVGGLTMVGSVLIPGAGLLVAGPLVGAITGGAIGTAAGGLIGALVGAGIPEEEAKFYEQELRERGRILVVAHVPATEIDSVRTIFSRYGAKSVRVS